MHIWCAPTWRFHTELCKFLRNISTNICGLGERTDLKLGEVSSLFIFNRITISWLYPLNGFRFIFLLRDSENNLLAVCPTKIAHSSGYGAYDTGGREGRLNTLERIMWLTKYIFYNNCKNSRAFIGYFSLSIGGQRREFITHGMRQWKRANNLTIFLLYETIGVSFSWVRPVIDNEFRHNKCQSSPWIHSAIVSWIHSYFENVMTKFMINNTERRMKQQQQKKLTLICGVVCFQPLFVTSRVISK